MHTRRLALSAALVLSSALASPAHAQDKGTLNPKPLPPLENPDAPSTPAKALFGRFRTQLKSEVIHEREAKGLGFDAF